MHRFLLLSHATALLGMLIPVMVLACSTLVLQTVYTASICAVLNWIPVIHHSIDSWNRHSSWLCSIYFAKMHGVILYQIFVTCHDPMALALCKAPGCLPLVVLWVMCFITSASWLKSCQLNTDDTDHHRPSCWQTNTSAGVCKCK